MFRAAFLAVFFVLAMGQVAAADVFVRIDAWNQRMTVFVDGQPRYLWNVSTGAAGYSTPPGTYTPFRMEAEHFSKEWDDAPMPHSIFFTERGHAIHGTSHRAALGTAASHGCVRLDEENAAFLFALVKEHGMKRTRVEIDGPPAEMAEREDYYDPIEIGGREIDVGRGVERLFRMFGVR
jgi:lipoprotein-anchoring transpeptidase ErfK/SrfK